MKYNKIIILLGAGFAQYCKGLGTKDINRIFSNYARWIVGEESLYDYTEKHLEDVYYDFNLTDSELIDPEFDSAGLAYHKYRGRRV